jgi:hypothetical protein
MSKYRCKILEMMDAGVADPTAFVEALVGWLSEADAKEFCEMYFEEAEEEGEE